MSNKIVISIMARDQVGMVAETAAVICQLGGNLEDISQTVTRGYFSMILIAAFNEKISCPAIRAALLEAEHLAAATIGVCDFVASAPATVPVAGNDNRYVLTASGPDRSGLVAAVSGYLRKYDINIVDLASFINQGEYTMIFLLDLPADTDVSKLKQSLQTKMEAVALQVELQHHALFRKTNEI